MSEFNFGSMKKKKSPPKKQKKADPTKSTEHSQVVQKASEPEGNMITQDDLQSMKNDILNALNHIITEGLKQHLFNRENLTLFIGRRGARGTKLCELRDFFYPTPASVIDTEVQWLRKEGLIKKNRHGWMSLTNKSP